MSESETPGWVPSAEQPTPQPATTPEAAKPARAAASEPVAPVADNPTFPSDIPAAAPAGDAGAPASEAPTTLGGLAPADRPEVLLAAAFAAGVLTAIILRALVSRK